jgi:hypothetical protein
MVTPTSEKKKAYSREWYRKNRERKIAYTKKYQKENNYSCEKTESQRKIRYIKRKTRLLFPITNQKCEFCNLKATEHHHYTEPIEIDKFYFVCHNCHIEQDLKLNKHSKLK